MNDPHDETRQLDADSGSEAGASDLTRDLTIVSVPQAESSDHGEVPEQVGRYRIERVLGHGGFGAVYLAKDDDLQRYVTVKDLIRIGSNHVAKSTRF